MADFQSRFPAVATALESSLSAWWLEAGGTLSDWADTTRRSWDSSNNDDAPLAVLLVPEQKTVSIQALIAERRLPSRPVAQVGKVAQLQHERGNFIPRPRLLTKSIPVRPARDACRSSQDCIRIKAVVGIELGDRARLAEVLDAERPHAMAAHAAEPGERLWVCIRYCYQGRIARQLGQQTLDVGPNGVRRLATGV